MLKIRDSYDPFELHIWSPKTKNQSNFFSLVHGSKPHKNNDCNYKCSYYTIKKTRDITRTLQDGRVVTSIRLA